MVLEKKQVHEDHFAEEKKKGFWWIEADVISFKILLETASENVKVDNI